MPLEVTICLGVTCSRMASREILAAAEKVARKYPGTLTINRQYCFSRCQLKDNDGLCPSVKIGDDWLNNADEVKVKRILKEKAKAIHAVISNPDDPFARHILHPPEGS